MATFLLWNVNRKPLDGLVRDLVKRYEVDVVLLVEYAFGQSLLPGMLLQDGFYRWPSSDGFGVFSHASHGHVRLRYSTGHRINMWRWTPSSGREGLITLVHGYDRRNYDDSTRRMHLKRAADAVRRAEARQGHQRSIIAGDFNAQPFDSAVVSADGLHAIGLQSVGAAGARKVQGAPHAHDFFYNPMWRAFGLNRPGDSAAATHFWLGSWAQEFGWFMLDQVVLRPSESVRFPEDRLQIVTQVGAVSLVDAGGRPDARTASDHLPIVFRWDL